MKRCCSRSGTLGRSSKSLIRHLRGAAPERRGDTNAEGFGPGGANSPADEVVEGVGPKLRLVEGGGGVPVGGRNGTDKQEDKRRLRGEGKPGD